MRTCPRALLVTASAVVAAVLTSTGHLNGAQAVTSQPVSTASPASTVRPILDKYCVTCHNERLKTAGLMLDSLDVEKVGARAEVWERVVQKLRAGTMPPSGQPRPDKETYSAVVSSLETGLDAAALASPDPGRPLIHRLNRVEYVNAIRDLLDLEIDGPSLLPADNSGYGFDNIADVLSVSPGLLDRYMLAARKIGRLAVGDATIRPGMAIYKVSPLLLQEDQRNDDLPFGTRGGLSVRHTFPVDGEYIMRIELQKDYGDQIRGRNLVNIVDVRVDGAKVKAFTVEKAKRALAIMALDGEKPNDGPLEFRVPVKAGARSVSVAMVKRTLMTESVGPERLPVSSTSYGQLNATSLESGRIDLGVENIQIEGPYNTSGTSETASRRRIFTCHPTSPQQETPCARTILTKIAHRAYRRPATTTEMQTLMTFYSDGRKSGAFDDGIEYALERILISPTFLFRHEQDASPVVGKVQRVTDLDLASRLSFFLWSTIPDEELLAAAEAGKLKDPVMLEQQVKRMLADPRAASLVTNFFGQWLMLRNVQSQLPDSKSYPEFDDSLREAFREETELFLETQLHEDRSALELLTANYTFVNERLAKHYGIPNVYGSHFRRVDLTDGKRAGLLGQGSILLVTAYPNRTSPVIRGKWLLENILGTPPPQPPKNVPPFPENDGKSAPKSVRERMEQHRKNPVCASCHFQLDPLGFGLENFDGIGEWRDLDANAPIDASGQFPNGTKFRDATEFRTALVNGYRADFVSTLTRKLTTYALGRGVEYYDMPAIRKIVRNASSSDYRWSSLIMGIVTSTPFQMRRVQS